MHKTMFHAKDATSLFTIEVHQYGGVATVVKVLVTWVKTIYIEATKQSGASWETIRELIAQIKVKKKKKKKKNRL